VRLGRARAGEWLAGLAGAGLIVTLFLDWYDGGATRLTAWQAFSVTDVLIALLALAGPALLAAQITRESPTSPTGLSVVCATCGALATAIVLARLVLEPGDDGAVGVATGAWIGLAAALGLLAGGWWSLESERTPGAAMPPVEVRASPPAH
jgi:hypothetical protein